MPRAKKSLPVTERGSGGKAALRRPRTLAKINKARLTVIEVIEELPHNVHVLDTEEAPP